MHDGFRRKSEVRPRAAHGGKSSLKLSDDHWGLFENEKPRILLEIYVPRASRAQMTSVFLINLQNNNPFPSKTRVIWVPSIQRL